MLWQQASRYCWSAKSYDYFIMVVKWLILYFPNVPCILMAVFIFLLVYQTILALYMILQKWRNDQHNIIQNQFDLTFSGTTENDNGCTGEATTTRRPSKREWFRRSWLNLLQFSFLHFPEKTRACSHLTRRRRRRVWRHHLRTTLCSGAAKQYQSRSTAAHRLPKTLSCSSGACPDVTDSAYRHAGEHTQCWATLWKQVHGLTSDWAPFADEGTWTWSQNYTQTSTNLK